MSGEKNSLLEDAIKNVKGYMTTKECYYLNELAQSVVGNIVEIGSHKGRSTCCLAIGHTNKVFSIDIWEDYPNTEFPSDFGIKTFSNPEVFKEYQSNIVKYDLMNVSPIKGDSTIIGQTWSEPISLLLVDGNHSYEGVKKDYEVWFPHIEMNRYILFHDYGSSSHPGVQLYVDEIMMVNDNLKFINIVDSLYVSQKI